MPWLSLPEEYNRMAITREIHVLHQLPNSIRLPFPTSSLCLPLYLYSVTESCILIKPISFQTSSSSLCQRHRPCSGSILLLWPLTFGSTCSEPMLVVLVSKQYLAVVFSAKFYFNDSHQRIFKTEHCDNIDGNRKSHKHLFLWVHRLKNSSEILFSGVFKSMPRAIVFGQRQHCGKTIGLLGGSNGLWWPASEGFSCKFLNFRKEELLYTLRTNSSWQCHLLRS